MTEILIKRLSKDVALPKYETEDSSGLDLAANTDKQIRVLEENLAKAKEYKIKLSGGLETIGLLTGEGEAPAEAPPTPPAEAPAE